MNGIQEPSAAPASSGFQPQIAPAPPFPPLHPSGAYAPRATGDPRRRSAILAGLLSVMPGLGQVYVGYYVRGFVHAIVVGSLISMLAARNVDEGGMPFVGIFLAFFWLYNIIDAARKASLVNLALEGIGTVDLPEDFKAPGFGGSIAAGLLLVIVGSIFLSKTLFGMSLAWIEDWWPAAPILFGLYLLVRGIQHSK